MRSGIAAAVFVGMSLLVVQSCAREPGTLGPHDVRLSVQARFSNLPTSGSGARVDRVEAWVIRPPDAVIASGSASIGAGETSVALELQVTLVAEREDLMIRVEWWGADFLLYRGETRMMVDGSASVVETPLIEPVAVSPVLAVTPASLSYAGQEGDADATHTFTVTNTGAGSLQWAASSDATWLTLTPASGALGANQSVTVESTATIATLLAGRHTATITTSAPDAAESPRQIQVDAAIDARASIEIEPGVLSFTAQEGTNPPSQTLTVRAPGSRSVSWTASDDAEWLSVLPGEGTLEPGTSQDVTLAVSSADLAAQTYVGTITVSDPAAAASSRTVTVSLDVTAPQRYTATVQGGGTGSGSVGSGSPGIDCTITGAVTSDDCSELYEEGATVELAPTAALGSRFDGWSGGCAGTGTCLLTMTSDRSVVATFTLVPGQMVVSPSTLTFTTAQGSSPTPFQFNLQNAGNSPLNWTASSDAGWLEVSPAAGTLQAGATRDITTTVSSASLAPGTYTATIAVSDPAVSNSPQLVQIALTVTPPIILNVAAQGTGAGTVSGPGIDCTIAAGTPGGDCTETYAADTQVNLTAVASSGSTFSGWSEPCTDAGLCQVTMTQNQSVTAAFTLIPAEIAVSPASLSYTALQGQSPAAQTFTITNTGSAPLNWTASDNTSWLSVSPASGTLGAGANQIVTANVAAEGPGTYDGTITVSDPAASNSPATVAVAYTVTPTYTLTVHGAEGSGDGTISGQGIDCTIAGAGVNGDCSETYAAGTQVTLTADPSPGSTFNGWGGACSGTGTCEVGMTQDISVNAEFSSVPPEITVSPDSLSFTTSVGTSPPSQSFDITNTGSVAVSWSAPDNSPWLFESPSSGSLAAGATATVTVSVSSDSLSPGFLYGEIGVEVPGASNPHQIVAVTLTVTPEGGFAPVLSDLSVQLLALNDSTSCTQSPAGSLFRFTMNYSDQDGDVDEDAALLTEFEYVPEGGSGSFTQPPEPGLTITGDGFSGEVQSLICIAFSSTTGSQQTFTLYDASGNTSNSVSITVNKPDGANGAGLPAAGGGISGIGIHDRIMPSRRKPRTERRVP